MKKFNKQEAYKKYLEALPKERTEYYGTAKDFSEWLAEEIHWHTLTLEECKKDYCASDFHTNGQRINLYVEEA